MELIILQATIQMLQKCRNFFEDIPELIKISPDEDTLAGVDDARKAMQLSPSEMRKRIQG